jgi:hemoglobin
MSKSIFEQLGGFPTVRKVVMEFYHNVMDEDELASYFEKTNMERLIDHQTKFVSYLLGGPVSYSDDHLYNVHARLKITDNHFDMIMEILSDAFEEYEVDDDIIEMVANEYEKRRSLIVPS